MTIRRKQYKQGERDRRLRSSGYSKRRRRLKSAGRNVKKGLALIRAQSKAKAARQTSGLTFKGGKTAVTEMVPVRGFLSRLKNMTKRRAER